MTVNEATLTELVDLARQRGGISLQDLRKAFPIDDMTIEDISDVLARLDKAGFDLEIDPALLTSTRHATAQDATTNAKPEQTRLPEMGSELGRHPPGSPTSTGDPIVKQHTARRSDAAASAPMLPWVLAFVIVVVAVFAAFAF